VLTDIFSAVSSRFNEGRTPPIPCWYGERYVLQNDAPPRIVWVPTRDVILPTRQIGRSAEKPYRSIRSRGAGVEISVWGPSPVDGTVAFELAAHAVVEQMLHDLLVVLHEVLHHGFYEIGTIEWMTAGELTASGYLCVMPLQVELPVVAGKQATDAHVKSEQSNVHLAK
jgi:hypothetical protein